MPGTDNSQADTQANQAGLWALSSINHVIGNRFSNSFNGMMYEPNAFGGDGRGAADRGVCTQSEAVGRLEGNTLHGHGRFGTYFIGSNYPTKSDQSLAAGGRMTDTKTCATYTLDGKDNGLSVAIQGQFD